MSTIPFISKNSLPLATLYTKSITTPIGTVIAVSDHDAVYAIQFSPFTPSSMFKNIIIKPGTTAVLRVVEQELEAYFRGTLHHFTIPLRLRGTEFQQKTWQQLTCIGYGTTVCYTDLACAINNPKATRAVGNANGLNPFVIVIPCHRVIAKAGTLGGYSSGIERKQWLLEHEQKYL